MIRIPFHIFAGETGTIPGHTAQNAGYQKVILMKLEKINDNQIKCILTSEDLAERSIRLSELAYGSEKAQELFRDMMQEAFREFGFTVDGAPLFVEAVPLNTDTIVLIITKVDDPDELDTRFSKFTMPKNQGTDIKDAQGADDILDAIHKIYESRKKSRWAENQEFQRNRSRARRGARR